MENIVDDKIIDCPKCKSNLCYSQAVTKDITNYSCMSCGYISNTLYREGNELFEKSKSVMADLYKDLIYKDSDGQMWFPNLVNLPEKGMVFINGTSTEIWEWVAVPAVEVKDEEKEKYPIPGKKGEYYKFRMDTPAMKSFGKDGFVNALEYVDLLK